jgi:hypothetical protein
MAVVFVRWPVAFTPAGLMQPAGVPETLSVVPGDQTRLPLKAWLSVLSAHHSVFDPSLTVLLTSDHVETTVQPCFASAWDGRPSG